MHRIEQSRHTRYRQGNFLRGVHGMQQPARFDLAQQAIILDKAFTGCILLEAVTLPIAQDTIEYKKAVYPGVFSGCTNLKRVTIPESILRISGEAFAGCTSLEEVSPPASLVDIDGYAFKDCKKLKSLELPKGLSGFSGTAIFGCELFEKFTVPSDSTHFTTYGDALVVKNGKNPKKRAQVGYVLQNPRYHGNKENLLGCVHWLFCNAHLENPHGHRHRMGGRIWS